MTSHKLNNYLKTYRKRAGFSQDEIAYLLGARSGTKTSRYERFVRTPSLETALAYEAIFGLPVRDLFAGSYQKVERNAKARARRLMRRLEREARPESSRKLRSLAAIAGAKPELTVAA